MSPQSGALRLSATIMEQSSYNDLHAALGRVVPFNVSVKFPSGKRSVAIHILSFENAGTVADDAFVIAGAAKSKCDEGSGFLGSDATSQVATKPVSIATIVEPSTDPIYPLSARNAQAQGSVVVGLAMDRFGRMRNMRIISSPRQDLAVAAIVAVRENHYKPYTVNGVAMDVDGFITVKFLYSTTCTGNRC